MQKGFKSSAVNWKRLYTLLHWVTCRTKLQSVEIKIVWDRTTIKTFVMIIVETCLAWPCNCVLEVTCTCMCVCFYSVCMCFPFSCSLMYMYLLTPVPLKALPSLPIKCTYTYSVCIHVHVYIEVLTMSTPVRQPLPPGCGKCITTVYI